MKSNKTLVLVHGTTANTSKFLHVSTNTQKKTQVNTEGSDIGTSLAAHPENTQVSVIVKLDELALVDGSDTELSLDGGDQRRALEESTGQGLEGAGELGLATGQLVVEADDSNVFLSGTLLGLDETSRTVDANNQTTGDLGIKSTAVTSLFASKQGKISMNDYAQGFSRYDEPKNALDPSDDFVTGRVGRLVQVDNTRADVRLDVALQRRTSIGDGSEVTRSDED